MQVQSAFYPHKRELNEPVFLISKATNLVTPGNKFEKSPTQLHYIQCNFKVRLCCNSKEEELAAVDFLSKRPGYMNNQCKEREHSRTNA